MTETATQEVNVMALVAVGAVGIFTMLFLYWFMREPKQVPVEKNIEEDDTQDKPKLIICFGSQTGTAEQYSKQLSTDGKKYGYSVRIIDLEDFEPQELEKEDVTLLFAMATYGEGEPTDNSHGFVRWAKQTVKQGEKPLTNAKFAVFGLGNRQYEHFNAMGKLTDDYLEKLGGTRFFDLGLGDDDKDLDADFSAWTQAMWTKLLGDVNGNINNIEDDSTKEKEDDTDIWNVAFDDSEDFAQYSSIIPTSEGASSTKFYFHSQRLTVFENTELRAPQAHGSTRHIEFWCDDNYYLTADNLAILPENDDADIDIVLKALGLDGKQRFMLIPPSGVSEETKIKPPFPTPCSIKLALKRYCDLTHKPKKKELIALESILHGGLDIENSQHKYVTLIDALKSCSKFQPNGNTPEKRLSIFLDAVTPHLQPRYYTISSSSIADKGKVHVTCSVVNLAPSRSGICSGYLASLRPGDKCAAFIRPSSFRMPIVSEKKSLPLVLVGPGTGLAPMRAILRERANKSGPFYSQVSSVCLYFGCQRPDHDHIYKQEMDQWHSCGALDKLEIAYSRLPENNGKKVYVQHLMRRPQDAEYLKSILLDKGGILFVCGATAMGRDVHDTLLEIFTSALKDNLKAEEQISLMRDQGRYIQELWSASA